MNNQAIPEMLYVREHPQKSHGRVIGLGIDQVWFLAVLACFALIVSLIPLIPNDFWWHLKIGEIISTQRSIPTTNIFSWSLSPDHPFTYGAWLGEYLLYLLYRLGEVPLIIFVRTLLAIITFGLVGYQAYRRSGSWRISGVVLVLVCAMASNNVNVRPQIWSWIPFVVYYILLSAFSEGKLQPKWLLLCVPIMIFWVNVHGAFILGFILLGIFLAGEALRTLFKQSGSRSWRDLSWLVLSGLLSALATVINPQFFGIFGYVIRMMTDKPSQELVVEWQSPAPDDYATILFFISILILFGVLIYSRYKPTLTEFLLILSFLWLAWSGLRYVIWYGIVVIPILGRAVKELLKDKPWMAVPPKNFLNLAIVVVLWLLVVLVQPWFLYHYQLPQGYAKLVVQDTSNHTLVSTGTPVAATQYLKEHPGGKLFNEMGYGSYLIWEIPQQGVFVDPRVELYPFNQWTDYIRISNGVRYNELLGKYGVDRLLINKEEQKELLISLETDPSWHREYQDRYSQIWFKNK